MSRSPHLYLNDIIESVRAIKEYTEGYDLDSFDNDCKTIDAVVRRFEIIGEAVKNLPNNL